MNDELLPHLFRTEFSKITSVLCKQFGIEHIDIAEDIASDTFLAAAETWSFKGLPENPTAWLYTVAKNKCKNFLKRNQIFSEKLLPVLSSETTSQHADELDLSESNIADSQLRMIFTLCHPAIPPEGQIGLALRILCGFGIDEIANAFLTNKETISKRLYRAKEKLREEKVAVVFPSASEITQRLDNVLTTLYLLFNEGYYSESADRVIREELCLEAIRMTHMLTISKLTNIPAVNALLAMMCLHASRLAARTNAHGELILYDDQDPSLWNQDLITRGVFYLHQSAQGNRLSKYHLEASIAYWHTRRESTKEKWENILQLYNQLLEITYSPIAALNRVVAVWRVHGTQVAIDEAEQLRLQENHYYHTLLGELYSIVDRIKAHQHFQQALELAKSHSDKAMLTNRLMVLN